MKRKLSDRTVKSLKAPSSGRLEIHDALLSGFGIRVGTSGRKAWFVRYYVHGKEVRETLGSYPVLSLEQAREEARKRQRLAAGDVDPRGEATDRKRSSFAVIAEEFIERYVRVHQKPTTQRDFVRHIRNTMIPLWGHKPIAAITRRDVHRLLDQIIDKGRAGATANRYLATARKLFNWAIDRGYIETSPAAGIAPPGAEQSRSRVLSDDELKRIWRACDELGYPFGRFTQVMIATGGQRLSDVAHMRWIDVRADTWVIPEPTKSTEAHAVPLSTLAVELLHGLPRFEGDYVFSTTSGERPVSGFGKAKAKLDALSGATGWRHHDIRRTVATVFGEHLGLHPFVAEAVQNRKSGTIKGVMAVYNRASYERDKREALEAWADYLRGLLADNVVTLRG